MKKILIILLVSAGIVSCGNPQKYRVNYTVVYPDTAITRDTVFISNSGRTPYTSSHRGTNYIRIGQHGFNYTTCPIRLNSWRTIDE